MVNLIEVQCRSILTRAGGYLKEVCSHSLNPYIGCGFGRSVCGVGCYVQHNGWLTKGREWGGFVEVKTNAAEVYLRTCGVEQRWAHRQGRPFSVFLSSSTEPWQPAERRFRITRGLLSAMQDFPPDRLILQTHGTGLVEDLKLIRTLSRSCDVRVHVSIEGDIERLPGLPPPPATVADRIDIVRRVSEAGIAAVVCLSPLYPLNHPESFFRRIADAGAQAVIIDHFIQGDGTAEGTRTLKTALPAAMAAVDAASTSLEYRDRIATIARKVLPVGISAAGFAGNFSRV